MISTVSLSGHFGCFGSNGCGFFHFYLALNVIVFIKNSFNFLIHSTQRFESRASVD